jgi:hypothetical protein
MVKPRLKIGKDLMLIVQMSCPYCANAFVGSSYFGNLKYCRILNSSKINFSMAAYFSSYGLLSGYRESNLKELNCLLTIISIAYVEIGS